MIEIKMGHLFKELGHRMGHQLLTACSLKSSKSQRKGHKKTSQNQLKGLKSRDGKIRTCDLLVPNQARIRL